MKTGIYVPLITPFHENGEINYEVLAKATKFVLKQGVDGIYAVGGTAEFCLLSTEERMRCLEVIVENAGGKEVVAHIGAQSTREAILLAKHAEKTGATMISAVAPYFFGYTFPQIKEYFHKIAHATTLPLMVYNASQGRSYSLEELKELLMDEKISCVKYTGQNFYFLERLIKAYPNKAFYTGCDEAFLAGAAVGSAGAIATTYNYLADKYIEARNLFLGGRNMEALEIIHKLNSITEILIATGNTIAGTKYIMALQGLDILPISREPFSQLTKDDKKRIREVYESTGFQHE